MSTRPEYSTGTVVSWTYEDLCIPVRRNVPRSVVVIEKARVRLFFVLGQIQGHQSGYRVDLHLNSIRHLH